ncbi:MAG: ABC transporter ATP-binding protein [Chitinophagales bacterium]
MPKLVISEIKKTLGTLLTLQEISIQAEEGTVVGILGPSGCGKTTLLHIVAGLMVPDSGKVMINDKDVTGSPGYVSYMQQKDLLLPSRTVIDNVSIPLVLQGIPAREARARASAYLARFGLEGFENYYPRQLSGGMRQRAAILRTYLFSSDILLFDEPFAALDAITRARMNTWLVDVLNELGPTVLLVTHDVDEALHLCNKIYVLSDCPTRIKLVTEVPFYRSSNMRTITDPLYQTTRDSILDSLSV